MVHHALTTLVHLNARLLNDPRVSGLRTHEVFCVARTGQKIRFAPAEAVPGQLALVLEKFFTLYDQAHDRASLAISLAYFWFGFIAVHPFSDGNGRTGRSFMAQKAREKGFVLKDPEELAGILLVGSLNDDLQLLTRFFYSHLEQG